MFPFRKRAQDRLDDSVILEKDKAVEKRLAQINSTTTKATQQATAAIIKVNAVIKEDTAFNLYYATHSKGTTK